ncbi:hypothetical protein B0J11DRAFT_585959 [Dendryphion nanum]|uniref:Uncharacterized protein n=1 Tax=Dendryphion nanum TaxID=256645 RepID=A0A9P9D1Q1_9PLEO|nr:hypothetical protein B0J11DRAFT_585959 [Dendryphion nanum]
MAGQQSLYASSAQAQSDSNGRPLGALDGSQVRPVAIDNQLFVIDGMLYETLRTIGKTRKDLHNARVAFATHEHAYHEEQATTLLESPEVNGYQCEESTAKNRGAAKKGRRRRRN